MKKLIQWKLRFFAKLILKKYKPEIVGITGSVGKTSTRDAVYTVLAAKYNVRRSIKNYNNEIGVPLTIIGAMTAGKSIFGWMKVFFVALKVLVFTQKDYPKILVLEMGVDKPGDMEYLTGIAKCKIGVVTMIGASHLEYFGSISKIEKEKGLLVKNVNKDGWVILNYDNDKTRKMKDLSRAKVVSYGFNKGADVSATELKFSEKDGKVEGVSFKIDYKGAFVPVFLPGVIGTNVVYSVLAAIAVGIVYDINLLDISKSFKKMHAPNGRMNLVEGIKDTLIIDDTYNSSPTSTKSALEVFGSMPRDGKLMRYAALGDMLELGTFSEQGHREVGKCLVDSGIDFLVAVGEKSRDIIRGAREAGMSEDFIFHFDNADMVGKFIQKRIKKGDQILIKGSQGMRMEKLVKEIMKEPLRAKELLVRQDSQWENV